MKPLIVATGTWAVLLFTIWATRRIRSGMYVDGRAGVYDPAAAFLDHLWLLLYEPIHTISRIWYRIRAIIRTLRTLSND